MADCNPQIPRRALMPKRGPLVESAPPTSCSNPYPQPQSRAGWVASRGSRLSGATVLPLPTCIPANNLNAANFLEKNGYPARFFRATGGPIPCDPPKTHVDDFRMASVDP